MNERFNCHLKSIAGLIRRWKIAPIVMNTPATRMDIRKDLTTGVRTFTVQTMYQRGFTDKNYLIPIPQAEIEKNANLVQPGVLVK